MNADVLADSIALVTGATSGIGHVAAFKLADAGAHVALVSRREKRLEAVADEIRTEHDREAFVVPTDVTEPDQVESAMTETAETFGGIDVAVANAGLSVDKDVKDLSVEEYQLMTDVNVNGMFYTAQKALPLLRESSGNMIFLGSFSGQHPRPYNPVSAATKRGQCRTRALR